MLLSQMSTIQCSEPVSQHTSKHNFLIYFPVFPCPQYLFSQEHKGRWEGYVQGVWGKAEVFPVKSLWDEWLALGFSACWLTG